MRILDAFYNLGTSYNSNSYKYCFDCDNNTSRINFHFIEYHRLSNDEITSIKYFNCKVTYGEKKGVGKISVLNKKNESKEHNGNGYGKNVGKSKFDGKVTI